MLKVSIVTLIDTEGVGKHLFATEGLFFAFRTVHTPGPLSERPVGAAGQRRQGCYRSAGRRRSFR